jgi:hypothetical protein
MTFHIRHSSSYGRHNHNPRCKLGWHLLARLNLHPYHNKLAHQDEIIVRNLLVVRAYELKK